MFPFDYMFNCCCNDCIDNGIMTELTFIIHVLHYHCSVINAATENVSNKVDCR